MQSTLIHKDELIINDEFEVETPADQSTGLHLAMRTTPYGEISAAPPFPSELIIPPSEYQPRIQEMTELKTFLSQRILNFNLPCKDQQQTNYCWINAPTHCVEITRLTQNQPMVILSPASAGAQIKNFKNVGGWGQEGLEWIVEHGLYPVDMWPANANSPSDRKYMTAAGKAAALDYRVTEWWELRPKNMAQLISCLLRRIPVAVGYDWWGHEVTAVDAIWLDGTVAIRIRNSWGMSWGNKGFSVLQGNKMIPADAVCARVAVAA